MNLDAARIVLRPRGVSEIFDLALRFAAAPAAKLYAKLGFLTLLPAWAICMAGRYAFDWKWGSVWLFALLLVTPLQGVFTVAIGRMMFADEVRPREVLGQYLRRLPAYLGTLILTRIMIAITSIAAFLVVPPFWMWGRVMYVHEACLLEQAGPIDAINRAARMVARGWVAAIGSLVLLTLVTAGFVFVAETLVNVGLFEFVLQLGHPFGTLFDNDGSPAALAGLFLAVPYWTTVRFLSYIDLRTRRDGWDVQLRFMAIQARASEAAETANEVAA